MNQFINLTEEQLPFVNGGVDGNYLFAGGMFATVGVGCLAVATVAAAPVAVVAATAYIGAWGIAGGVTCGVIGAIK